MSILTKQQILELLQETDQEVIAELYRRADRVRQEQVGQNVHLRGLIEFSSCWRQS